MKLPNASIKLNTRLEDPINFQELCWMMALEILNHNYSSTFNYVKSLSPIESIVWLGSPVGRQTKELYEDLVEAYPLKHQCAYIHYGRGAGEENEKLYQQHCDWVNEMFQKHKTAFTDIRVDKTK